MSLFENVVRAAVLAWTAYTGWRVLNDTEMSLLSWLLVSSAALLVLAAYVFRIVRRRVGFQFVIEQPLGVTWHVQDVVRDTIADMLAGSDGTLEKIKAGVELIVPTVAKKASNSIANLLNSARNFFTGDKHVRTEHPKFFDERYTVGEVATSFALFWEFSQGDARNESTVVNVQIEMHGPWAVLTAITLGKHWLQSKIAAGKRSSTLEVDDTAAVAAKREALGVVARGDDARVARASAASAASRRAVSPARSAR